MSYRRSRVDFDTAASADPYDAWVTITLVVASAVLSVQRFNGSDFDMLIGSHAALPRETWRHASSALLHGNWIHLIFNLYWCMKFGVLLEAMLGGPLLAVLIVALAWVSGAAQWAFSGPSIGLSGIGYGMFALLWALDRWHPRCRGLLDRRVTELFAAWFFLCLIADYYDILPIGNVAHAAGALLGGLIGWALAARSGRAGVARAAGIAGTILVVVLLSSTKMRNSVNYGEPDWTRSVKSLEDHEIPSPDFLRLVLDEDIDGATLEQVWLQFADTYRRAGREEWAAEAERMARESRSSR